MPAPTIGAYEGRSQPCSYQAAVILPAIVRSVTPGLTDFIISRCAAMEAVDAFFNKSISPGSFTSRNGIVKVVTSRAGGIEAPRVEAVKPRRDSAALTPGCAQMLNAMRRSSTINLFRSSARFVMGSTLSIPVALVTPGVAASILAPV